MINQAEVQIAQREFVIAAIATAILWVISAAIFMAGITWDQAGRSVGFSLDNTILSIIGAICAYGCLHVVLILGDKTRDIKQDFEIQQVKANRA